MITSCLIFLASFSNGDGIPTINNLNQIRGCIDKVPSSMVVHLPHYVEHFDEENLYTAVRIGWCESRGKGNAYRSEDDDSGVMQFIPSTWNWIAEKNDLPAWDEWIILHYGQPYGGPLLGINERFLQAKQVQYVPYYNIKMASILAEDTYSKVTFRDWNSSKWCWENPSYYEKRWRDEGF